VYPATDFTSSTTTSESPGTPTRSQRALQ
jgi:hypothetical protein